MPKCGRKSDLPPFESQVGGIFNQELVNRNAPFGTKFTPVLRTKIIGGKTHIIQETQRSFKPTTLKASNYEVATHDDGVQTDFNDSSSSNRYQQKDSKDKKTDKYWNNHTILPPISANESNLPSFYQYAKQGSVANQPKEELKATQSDTKLQVEISYQPKDYSKTSPRKEYQWKPAAGYSYLPTQSITLTKDQEIFLINKLAVELEGCKLDQVRRIYEDLASNDLHLTGLATYTDVGLALQKHGIYPNLNTLRLLASTCVSDTELGVVNYEKLLSYIITAIKKSIEMEQLNNLHNFVDDTTRDTQTALNTKPPTHDMASSEGDLLRMIQQQLLISNSTLNIERLRNEFSKADRSHRLTLSHTEIKDICQSLNVPIQSSVINQMLAHCQTHGDGQYRWRDFIDILERVQPHPTGLLIPQSKRPVDFAKVYPQPNESWPHPDPNFHKSKPLELSDKDIPPTLPNNLPPPNPGPRFLQHQHVSAPAALGTMTLQQQVPANSKPQQGSNISPRGHHQQQDKPWIIKDPKQDWFDGFKKLAAALYRNDLSRQGSMKPDQCKWLITEYNDIYDLHLPPHIILDCITRNTTSSGTEIDSLLSSLLTSCTG